MDLTGRYAEARWAGASNWIVDVPVVWSRGDGFVEVGDYEYLRSAIEADVLRTLSGHALHDQNVIVRIVDPTAQQIELGRVNHVSLFGQDYQAPADGVCDMRPADTRINIFESRYDPYLGPHEFGHALGLEHVVDNEFNLMYPDAVPYPQALTAAQRTSVLQMNRVLF